MPQVSFHTLGCKLNLAETSNLRRTFQSRGYAVVAFGATADVTVINTCSVTAEADRKCRQAIRKARRTSPDAYIIVTGCYAQLRPDEIAGLDGVDAVLGNQEKARLFSVIDRFTRKAQTQVSVSCIGDDAAFDPARLSDDRTRAFLKVQDGCDYSCAFCTIPLARGRSRSAPAQDIVDQARALAERGVEEIVLSGVNIGLFGRGSLDADGGSDLLQLLRGLARVDGIQRYRISSIEPNLLTDAIIDFVARTPSFVPHFHIPLQSGDDTVLGAMRRRYRRQVYAQKAQRIVEHMPDACIGADVIVGYPAESNDRFTNTRTFLADLPIAYIHVFTYSERPDTAAVTRVETPPIPKAVRRKRNGILRSLSERKRHAFASRFLHTDRPVLWELTRRNGHMYGYTDNYIRVRAPFDRRRVGQVESVRIGSPAAELVD